MSNFSLQFCPTLMDGDKKMTHSNYKIFLKISLPVMVEIIDWALQVKNGI